jgi:hypothetical protein
MSNLGFDFTQIIGFSSACGIVILIRCVYRVTASCKVHTNCCRTRHADDGWMAFALIPLILRAVFLDVSFYFGRSGHTENEYVVSRKLLIPGRLAYGLLYVKLSNSLLF